MGENVMKNVSSAGRAVGEIHEGEENAADRLTTTPSVRVVSYFQATVTPNLVRGL